MGNRYWSDAQGGLNILLYFESKARALFGKTATSKSPHRKRSSCTRRCEVGLLFLPPFSSSQRPTHIRNRLVRLKDPPDRQSQKLQVQPMPTTREQTR